MKATERNYHEALGARLREVRVRCGLSQDGMGEILGVTFQQVQKYEKGLNRIAPYRLILWATATETTASELLSEAVIEKKEDAITASKMNLNFVRGFQKLPDKAKGNIVSLIDVINGEGDE